MLNSWRHFVEDDEHNVKQREKRSRSGHALTSEDYPPTRFDRFKPMLGVDWPWTRPDGAPDASATSFHRVMARWNACDPVVIQEYVDRGFDAKGLWPEFKKVCPDPLGRLRQANRQLRRTSSVPA